MPLIDSSWPLDLPSQGNATLAPDSKASQIAMVLRLRVKLPCRACENSAGLQSFWLSSSEVRSENLCFWQMAQWRWCCWPTPHLKNHCHRHFSALHIHFLPLKSYRLLPAPPKMEWKILFMYVYYPSTFWGSNFYSNPNIAWQNKIHPISATSFSPLTATPILPVSSCLYLCTDAQDCVFVSTSPALLVYMYTFVFLLLPHSTIKSLNVYSGCLINALDW